MVEHAPTFRGGKRRRKGGRETENLRFSRFFQFFILYFRKDVLH